MMISELFSTHRNNAQRWRLFGERPRVGTSERRRTRRDRARMLPARQPIARLGWMIVCRDTQRLLQVGKGGHAGLAVELRLLHSVGEGEPEGLDELLPVLVVPKCQLRLYKVNWDRHAVCFDDAPERRLPLAVDEPVDEVSAHLGRGAVEAEEAPVVLQAPRVAQPHREGDALVLLLLR